MSPLCWLCFLLGKIAGMSASFFMPQITLSRQKGPVGFGCCPEPGDVLSQCGAGRQLLDMAGSGGSSTQRGWDQPALCWAVLGHTGLAGSLLQKGFLQGLSLVAGRSV